MDKMDHTTRITTALLLAAGTGSRLKPFTDNMPKCLTKVNEIEILGRLITCLRENSFKRLVVVVGYFDHQIRNFLRSEEHTSELQSRRNLVCRLLLEKQKKNKMTTVQH